jgi:hypothetical protein
MSAPETNAGHSLASQTFKLSFVNKLYLAAVIVVYIAVFIATGQKTAYHYGELTGRILSTLLLPLLFAWIFWRVSGKRRLVGNATFAIVLSLTVLGQFAQFAQQARESQVIQSLKQKQEDFKQAIADKDDAAALSQAYEEYADSVASEFTRLSESSTGAERQLYTIMCEFMRDSRALAQRWQDSFDAVAAPRILDYSLLNSDDEFDYQRNVIRRYIEETTSYREYAVNMVADLEKRLSVLGEGNQQAKDVLAGASDKQASQWPIFDPLMRAHLEYGNNMIEILDLLQAHSHAWSYKNDELAIDSDDLLTKFSMVIEAMTANEEAINTLSSKLTDEL